MCTSQDSEGRAGARRSPFHTRPPFLGGDFSSGRTPRSSLSVDGQDLSRAPRRLVSSWIWSPAGPWQFARSCSLTRSRTLRAVGPDTGRTQIGQIYIAASARPRLFLRPFVDNAIQAAQLGPRHYTVARFGLPDRGCVPCHLSPSARCRLQHALEPLADARVTVQV